MPFNYVLGGAVLPSLAVALGTLVGGWRIVKTIGSRITQLKPVQGFCAERRRRGRRRSISSNVDRIAVIDHPHGITGAIMGVQRLAGSQRFGAGYRRQHHHGIDHQVPRQVLPLPHCFTVRNFFCCSRITLPCSTSVRNRLPLASSVRIPYCLRSHARERCDACAGLSITKQHPKDKGKATTQSPATKTKRMPAIALIMWASPNSRHHQVGVTHSSRIVPIFPKIRNPTFDPDVLRHDRQALPFRFRPHGFRARDADAPPQRLVST